MPGVNIKSLLKSSEVYNRIWMFLNQLLFVVPQWQTASLTIHREGRTLVPVIVVGLVSMRNRWIKEAPFLYMSFYYLTEDGYSSIFCSTTDFWWMLLAPAHSWKWTFCSMKWDQLDLTGTGHVWWQLLLYSCYQTAFLMIGTGLPLILLSLDQLPSWLEKVFFFMMTRASA